MRKIHHTITAAATAAFLTLSGCNNEPETVEAGGEDPMAEELANAAPVELPPSIQVSRTYRCKDNSLIYVDFYTNNTAQLRTEPGGTPTQLTAAEAGAAYTAEGYSLSGNGTQVDYSAPGKGSQNCKA